MWKSITILNEAVENFDILKKKQNKNKCIYFLIIKLLSIYWTLKLKKGEEKLFTLIYKNQLRKWILHYEVYKFSDTYESCCS